MKRTLLSVCLLVMLSNLILAQQTPKSTPPKPSSVKSKDTTVTKPVDTTHYIYDTTKTLCTYMVNLTTGESPTAYLIRITKSTMDFVQPTPEDLKKDSLTLKKQKVLVSILYFVPISVNEPVKKGEKSKNHIEYTPIPQGMVVKDYDGNLDYILKLLQDQEKLKNHTDSVQKKVIPIKKK
jgi:hypothetical protein